jgi:tetratricopeptide (TPR) repeat protein
VALHRTEHLQDPGAELLDRAQSLWGRYGRMTSIALGVIVVGGGLVFLTMQTRVRSEAAAADKLADANSMFWQGDYKRSQDIAKTVSQQWPDTPSGREAHRIAGDDAFWTGDFKTAITEYRAYLAKESKGLLADDVRRSLANALENEKQPAEAAGLYEQLVGVYDRETSAEFLAAAARCQRAAGHNAEATKLLQRLVDEYGETTLANGARVDLAEIAASAH